MKKIALFVIAAFILGSCEKTDGDLGNENLKPTPIELSTKGKALVEADNAFGLDVFKRINSDEPENFTISPLSVSLALAMTYNGAKGETKTAMEEALKKAGFSTEEINQSYKDLVKALLEADEKVTLEIAQSIWYRQDFNVLSSFIDVNRDFYDAEVNSLDFSRADALDIINGWIEDKTHDKIQDMISEIDPQHVMFLINAIYFNGTWRTKFKEDNTEKRPFYALGKTLEVDMMSKSDSVAYQSNDLFQAIELPYGRGNFNMVVLLPTSTSKFDELVEALTPENWKTWMGSFSFKPEVDIYLPKFKAEFEIKLNDILSAMGMGVAFTSQADFSGINGDGGLFIDYVQHNTFIDVNEKGTEAAAATVVAIRETSVPEITIFNANRPFIFAITEKETGAILFIGKMVEPEYE